MNPNALSITNVNIYHYYTVLNWINIYLNQINRSTGRNICMHIYFSFDFALYLIMSLCLKVYFFLWLTFSPFCSDMFFPPPYRGTRAWVSVLQAVPITPTLARTQASLSLRSSQEELPHRMADSGQIICYYPQRTSS